MVVDAALFLWSKAKSMFQKHQSGSSENPKYLQKMENPNKVNSPLKIWVFFHFMIISVSLHVCFYLFHWYFRSCYQYTCISVFLFCLYLVILVFDCIVMFEPFFWPICIFCCPSPCMPFCLWLQWVYILDVVHKVLCWCGISSVDPALTAEVVLRLALVFESSAHMDEGKPSVYIILYHSYITTLSQWNGLAPN